MKCSLPIRLFIGKTVLFLSFLLMVAGVRAQVYTLVDYSTSGLTNTVSSGSTADVLAGNPVINGLTHSTLSSQLYATFGYPAVNETTYPPGYDGTSLRLGSSLGWTYSFSANQVYTEILTDAYTMNYNFIPGFTYFVTLNYSCNTPNSSPGLGLSVGSAQMTGDFSSMGSAVVNEYTNWPSTGYTVVNGDLDNFIASPSYASYLSFGSSPTFADLSIPPFTVNTSTTGLNLEALPSLMSTGAQLTTYLEIKNVTIVGISPIAFPGPVCTSTTGSITSSWPVSWSVAPAGIVSLSASGNVVTLTKITTGDVTLTATLTGPDGRSYQVSKAVHAGPVSTAPVSIEGFNSGQVFAPNSTYQFTSYTGNTWSVGNGTILSGQGTNTITVKTINTTASSTPFDVGITENNGCGVGPYLWMEGTIGSGGRPDVIISPNPATSTITLTQDATPGPLTKREGAHILIGGGTPPIMQTGVTAFKPIRQVKIYDAGGRLRKSFETASTSTALQLDVSDLPIGIYFVEMAIGTETQRQKIVIMR